VGLCRRSAPHSIPFNPYSVVGPAKAKHILYGSELLGINITAKKFERDLTQTRFWAQATIT
jgi:hypothetical protein